jgi:hypothetical protein
MQSKILKETTQGFLYARLFFLGQLRMNQEELQNFVNVLVQDIFVDPQIKPVFIFQFIMVSPKIELPIEHF